MKERKITLKSATEAMRKIRVGQFNSQTYPELEEEVWEFLNGLYKEKTSVKEVLANVKDAKVEFKNPRVEQKYLVLSRGADILADVNDTLQGIKMSGFILKEVIELNEMFIFVMERTVYE